MTSTVARTAPTAASLPPALRDAIGKLKPFLQEDALSRLHRLAQLPEGLPAPLLADLLTLNDPQFQAATVIEGPVLILAGAGSGKTNVLSKRIAYLVASGNARADEICAVTFTNKSAREMRERIGELVGGSAESMSLSTFHSMGARMLRTAEFARKVGLQEGFSIYDEADALATLQRAIERVGFDLQKARPTPLTRNDLVRVISTAKDELLTPEQLAAQSKTETEKQIARVYWVYDKLLRAANAVDFDDLIKLPAEMLRDNAAIRAHYHRKWKYLLVDEYQDTSHGQYELVKQLAAGRQNLTVVGDDDQAIYGFRNADVRNILDFERDYPQAVRVTLDQNYRSHQLILDAAHGVIKNNAVRMDKKLWSSRKDGEKVHVMPTQDEAHEAQEIAAEVQRLVQGRVARSGGYTYKDCAVLYRTNAQARALEEELMRQGIPYVVAGGTRFYERKEIKDAIAYLAVLHNPRDVAAFTRIINTPRRGLGDKTVEMIVAHSQRLGIPILDAISRDDVVAAVPTAAQAPLREFAALMGQLREQAASAGPDAVLRTTLERIHYVESLAGDEKVEERKENLTELIGLASEYAELPAPLGLQSFLENAALVSSVDELEQAEKKDPNAVTLITVHMSKGLEYPVCFVAGMEEQTFPHKRSLDTEEGVSEERRLAYVALTRAKDRLYVSFVRTRHLYGQSQKLELSRFLRELPVDLLVRHTLAVVPQRAIDRVRRPARRPAPRAAAPSPAPAATIPASADHEIGD